MPRRSVVLDHPRRAVVDAQVLAGDRPLRDIAREFGLPYEALKRWARRVRAGVAIPGQVAPAGALADPAETFRQAFGQEPMAHQAEYLGEARSLVVRKGRQVGMTQAAAALAIHVARSGPGRLVAIISPSMRQSTEVGMRARVGLWELGERLVQDSTGLLRLDNGSRILSLPGTDRSVRGYAADLLVVDEAAWVSETTWNAGRPTVSATGGRVIVQSTPGVPAGWFYDLATDVPEGWAAMHVPSEGVPTIDPELLARERREMPPAIYANEYRGEFAAAAALGRWFPAADFDAHIDPRFKALKVDLPGREQEAS